MKQFNSDGLVSIFDKMSEECLAVSVKMKRWSGSTVDKESAATLASSNSGEASGWNNASMRLLPDTYRKEIGNAVSKVGKYLDAHSLPLPGGFRMVQAKEYSTIMCETDKEIAGVNDVVQKILDNLTAIKSEMMSKLGDKYSDALYPSDEEIRGAFQVESLKFPLTPPKNVSADDTDKIRQEMQEMQKMALASAKADIDRALGVSRFGVEQFKQIVSALQKMGLIDDASDLLEKATGMLLKKGDAKEEVRVEAKKEADSIMASFGF